jgi:hypothetical protein
MAAAEALRANCLIVLSEAVFVLVIGITVMEGSGLSYDNRVTAPAMAALLRLFTPYRSLLKEEDGVPHKTGTLWVTKTLVGYLDTPSHGTVRFVIALGQERPALGHRGSAPAGAVGAETEPESHAARRRRGHTVDRRDRAGRTDGPRGASLRSRLSPRPAADQ